LRRLRVAHAGSTNRHRALAAWLTVLGDLALRRASDSAKTAHPAGSAAAHASGSAIATAASCTTGSTFAAHPAASSGTPVAATAVVRPTPSQGRHPEREDTYKAG